MSPPSITVLLSCSTFFGNEPWWLQWRCGLYSHHWWTQHRGESRPRKWPTRSSSISNQYTYNVFNSSLSWNSSAGGCIFLFLAVTFTLTAVIDWIVNWFCLKTKNNNRQVNNKYIQLKWTTLFSVVLFFKMHQYEKFVQCW